MINKLFKSKQSILTIFFIVITILVLVTGGLYFKNNQIRSSIVTGTYDDTPTDGCGGFILKNGTHVATFCGWTGATDIEVQGQIDIGDKVQYRLEGKGAFIRSTKN